MIYPRCFVPKAKKPLSHAMKRLPDLSGEKNAFIAWPAPPTMVKNTYKTNCSQREDCNQRESVVLCLSRLRTGHLSPRKATRVDLRQPMPHAAPDRPPGGVVLQNCRKGRFGGCLLPRADFSAPSGLRQWSDSSISPTDVSGPRRMPCEAPLPPQFTVSRSRLGNPPPVMVCDTQLTLAVRDLHKGLRA